MALVPRIDRSCPLSIDEQRRISGHCGHCDTHVHALDGMDDAARRALLARAEGPICVSYRRSSRVAQMAAIALTLVAATSFAGEPADAATSTQSSIDTQAAGGPAASKDKQERVKELGSLIVLGAVADPRDAEWVDDSALPELPVIAMDTDARVEAAAQPGAADGVSGTDRIGTRR